MVYLVAMNELDRDTNEAPVALQVAWWLCALYAAAAAFVAGARGGLIPGLIASALVWGSIATGVYFLLGPTCPLSAIGPTIATPDGMPPIRLQETFSTLCSVGGTVAGSVDARWALKTGALAALLAALGGLTAFARSSSGRATATDTG